MAFTELANPGSDDFIHFEFAVPVASGISTQRYMSFPQALWQVLVYNPGLNTLYLANHEPSPTDYLFRIKPDEMLVTPPFRIGLFNVVPNLNFALYMFSPSLVTVGVAPRIFVQQWLTGDSWPPGKFNL